MALFGSYNRFIGIGNPTSKPKIRETRGGTKVTNVRLAFNERVKKGDEWVDDTLFLECTFWDKKAEWMEKWCKKGKPLLVEGRIKSRSYEDPDENEVTVVYCLVDAVTFFRSDKSENKSDDDDDEDEDAPRRRKKKKKEKTSEGYVTDPDQFDDDDDVPF